VQAAVTQPDIRVEVSGSDLVWQGRKFSGSAQRRQHTHFLHHGTILYQFDIPAITRYLKEPARQPQHREKRDHATFLTCLPVNRGSLAERLCEVWNAVEEFAPSLLGLTAQLVARRYSRQDWNSGTGKWHAG
jgi:lipoate-protein ligase A